MCSYLYLHQKFFAKCTSDSILTNVEQVKGQSMRMTMSMVACTNDRGGQFDRFVLGHGG